MFDGETAPGRSPVNNSNENEEVNEPEGDEGERERDAGPPGISGLFGLGRSGAEQLSPRLGAAPRGPQRAENTERATSFGRRQLESTDSRARDALLLSPVSMGVVSGQEMDRAKIWRGDFTR